MTEMTRMETHPASRPTQPTDDLKQIGGIGPAIERRLNAGGIFTFAQLAELSLDELAKMFAKVPGHSRERLAEKDWIGQARGQTREPARSPITTADSVPAEPENDALDFRQRQRYASFTVELLVAADRRIRRTRVYNIQAQQEVSWAGWDPLRLIGFLAESGDLDLVELPLVESLDAGADAIPEPVIELPVEPRHLSGTLVINKVVLLAAGYPTLDLPAGQPFQFHLGLELNGAELAREATVEYAVTVDAKRVGSGQTVRLGAAHGSLAGPSPFEADVDVAGLPAGLYRPDVFVSLTLIDGDLKQTKTFRAVREGQSFIVY